MIRFSGFKVSGKKFLRIGFVLLLCLFLAACGLRTPTPSKTGAGVSPEISASSGTPASIKATIKGTVEASIQAQEANKAQFATPAPLPFQAAPATALPLAPTPTPLPPPRGEIVVWEALEPAQAVFFKSSIESFQGLFPEVEFKVEHFEGDDLYNRLKENSPTDSSPYLVLGPVGQLGRLQPGNFLSPVQPFFEKSFYEKIAPNLLDALKINGVIWGLPYNFSTSLVLYYNKKLLSISDLPSNWEKLTSFVRANPAKKNEFYPFGVNLFDPNFLLGVLGANGGRALDENNLPDFDSSFMRESLQFVQDAVFKNKVATMEPDFAGMVQLFKNGRVSMLLGGDELLPEFLDPALRDKLEPGIAPLPLVKNRPLTPPNRGMAYFVGKGAENGGPKLSALRLFLSYQMQPGQQRKLLNQAGLLPVITPVLEELAEGSDSLYGIIASQLEYTRPIISVPGWNAFFNSVKMPLSSVITSRASASEGAAAMQDLALKYLNLTKK